MEEGGFIHRMMAPLDWNYGNIPQECYNKDLSKREIFDLILKEYEKPDNLNRLIKYIECEGDSKLPEFSAKMKIEIIAEIDAYTVWNYNFDL